MEWTNRDWMRTYECVVQLIMFIDLERSRNNGHNYFSDEQKRAIELKKKLEYIFREDDGTPTPEEVQSELLPWNGNKPGGSHPSTI